MTTSEFVFGMQKTIDLCYLKLVPDRWQRKLFSRRFLWPGITAYMLLSTQRYRFIVRITENQSDFSTHTVRTLYEFVRTPCARLIDDISIPPPF